MRTINKNTSGMNKFKAKETKRKIFGEKKKTKRKEREKELEKRFRCFKHEYLNNVNDIESVFFIIL